MLRLRRYGLYVLALLATANFLNYANRNVALAIYDDLRHSFGASNQTLGLIGSVFMLPHALATPVVGWLGDHLDRRRLMAGGMVVWCGAAVLAATASSMGAFLAARALAGLATAACVPIGNALVASSFDPAKKARTLSIFNLGMFLGGSAGFAIGERAGYPLALWLVGVPSLVLAGLVAVLRVEPRPTVAAGASAAMRAFSRDSHSILRRAPMRWIIGGAVLMAFASGGYLSWFLELLHQKGMGDAAALGLFMVALGGGVVGVVTGGQVADRMHRRRPAGRLLAVSLGLSCAVPCALAALAWSPGPAMSVATCAMMFFISWYHGPLVASVDDQVPAQRSATAQGLYIFLMHLLGTAPSSWLVGLTADHVSLKVALLLPTAAMALAALAFAGAARSVARSPVLKPGA